MTHSARGAKAACSRVLTQLLDETKKFSQDNYRQYFGALVSQQKESLKSIDDPIKLGEIKEQAKTDLEQMRRMVTMNQLYVKNRSILETEGGKDKKSRSVLETKGGKDGKKRK